MTDQYDEVIRRAQRIQQYTYRPFRRAMQRAKGLFASVAPGTLGFDISVWQTFVDFNLAKAAGLTWVYIRALYGLVVDGKFPVHFPAAKGIVKRAAYLYYRDYEDPKLQAQKLHATCLAHGDGGEDTGGEDTPGDFMPVLDLETIGNPTLTASKVQACLEELQRLFGKTPIIYSGYYVIRDALVGEKGFLAAYMLIVAAYPFPGWTDDLPQKVLQYPPLIPAPFVMWTANADEPLTGRVVGWQFTASAPADLFGASGNFLDLDWCSPAFAKQVLDASPPVDPPPSPGDDMTQPIQCVTLGAYLNTRAQPSASAVDTGNFYKNEEAVCFPEKTFVKKADLPNKEIWRLVLKADGTVGWAAEWHPTIWNAAGQQYAAIVDLAPPAPPVPTVLLQAIGDVNLRYYSETNAQGHPIMKLPPVGSRPKFSDGAQIVASPTLVNADGTVDYYQVLNGHLATPATYTPPAGHTGWFVSETDIIQL